MLATFLSGMGWRGALVVGGSGSGKSDFALRALSEGWRLVADDRVILWVAAGRPFGRAPDALAGLLELRGQGMASASALAFAEIALVAHLRTPGERQPEPADFALCEVRTPAVEIAPFEASGPQRLRRMVEQITARL